MADKMQRRPTKSVDVKFGGTIEFEGSVAEFKAVMADLEKLSRRGVKVGTWPTPEHPTKGTRIETIPLPEIGGHIRWPWPWPWPFPGFIDIPRYLGKDLLEKITQGMPRFPIIDDICGGIRTAHLHMHGEVVLLDQAGFKEAVQQVASELAGNLAETAEYPETVGAIGRLTQM